MHLYCDINVLGAVEHERSLRGTWDIAFINYLAFIKQFKAMKCASMCRKSLYSDINTLVAAV
jgi:hypothetical protein